MMNNLVSFNNTTTNNKTNNNNIGSITSNIYNTKITTITNNDSSIINFNNNNNNNSTNNNSTNNKVKAEDINSCLVESSLSFEFDFSGSDNQLLLYEANKNNVVSNNDIKNNSTTITTPSITINNNNLNSNNNININNKKMNSITYNNEFLNKVKSTDSILFHLYKDNAINNNSSKINNSNNNISNNNISNNNSTTDLSNILKPKLASIESRMIILENILESLGRKIQEKKDNRKNNNIKNSHNNVNSGKKIGNNNLGDSCLNNINNNDNGSGGSINKIIAEKRKFKESFEGIEFSFNSNLFNSDINNRNSDKDSNNDFNNIDNNNNHNNSCNNNNNNIVSNIEYSPSKTRLIEVATESMDFSFSSAFINNLSPIEELKDVFINNPNNNPNNSNNINKSNNINSNNNPSNNNSNGNIGSKSLIVVNKTISSYSNKVTKNSNNNIKSIIGTNNIASNNNTNNNNKSSNNNILKKSIIPMKLPPPIKQNNIFINNNDITSNNINNINSINIKSNSINITSNNNNNNKQLQNNKTSIPKQIEFDFSKNSTNIITKNTTTTATISNDINFNNKLLNNNNNNSNINNNINNDSNSKDNNLKQLLNNQNDSFNNLTKNNRINVFSIKSSSNNSNNSNSPQSPISPQKTPYSTYTYNINNNSNNSGNNSIFSQIKFHEYVTIDQLVQMMDKNVEITHHGYSSSWGPDNQHPGFQDTYPFKTHTVTENCWEWFINSWAAQREFGFSLCFNFKHLSATKVTESNDDAPDEDITFLPRLIELYGIVVCWAPSDIVYYLPLSNSHLEYYNSIDPLIIGRVNHFNKNNITSKFTTYSNEQLKKRWEFIKIVFENPTSYKYSFNLKPQLKLFIDKGIKVQDGIMDPKLAAWVDNSEQNKDKTLGQLYSTTSKPFKSKSNGYYNNFDRSFYNCHKSFETMRSLLKSLYNQRSETNKLLEIFLNIEMRVLPIFAKMEYVGIGYDDEAISICRQTVERKISYLEHKAKVLLPGRVFSLTSTTDVSEVLFTDLKIQPPEIAKSSKRGNRIHYSTEKAVLEQVIHLHPIVSIIIEHRSLSHLITHYLDVLSKYQYNSNIYPMKRIYATIQQTIVPTGRISMENPNLQNISKPVEFIKAPDGDFSQESISSFDEPLDRFEYLRDQHYLSLLEKDKSCGDITVSIRNGFVSAKGHKFLSVDYCQLELRILAHISQDPKLLEMFNYRDDVDVFKFIFHQMYNIEYKKVSDSDRNQAKHLMYGILYGMGIKSIASNLHTTKEIAKSKLQMLENLFPELIKYLESIETTVEQDGFITTLYGRKRKFSNIHSIKSNFRLICKDKRGARNSVPQGTAADITKLAMINIQDEFNKHHLKAQMVLQLHDEILFEIPENEIYHASKIIKYQMENVVKLSVNLPIKMSIGNNWGTLINYQLPN